MSLLELRRDAPLEAKPENPPLLPAADAEIVRFSGHQRAQHFIMMSSVLLLVFTGMPQKFSALAASQWMIDVCGGLDNARFIHRCAGFAMIFASVYHLAWLFWIIVIKKEGFPFAMLPSLKDVRDFFHSIGWCLGLAAEKPQFGRYTFIEKFDYWAVFWGVPVMGLTGLILMYPLTSAQLLPQVTLPVAQIAHSDEALLASGWIFIVHFYNAHLASHIFPMNKSIFTGRVSVPRYQHEHPLEYAEMVAGKS